MTNEYTVRCYTVIGGEHIGVINLAHEMEVVVPATNEEEAIYKAKRLAPYRGTYVVTRIRELEKGGSDGK